jgi:hypothetical protein
MKIIIFLLLLTTQLFASSSRIGEYDQFKSADRTKTWSLPTNSGTMTKEPTVFGSDASPISIVAGSGIDSSVITMLEDNMVVFVEGSGAAINISAADQILNGNIIGQKLKVVGKSASNTVQFDDGNNLILNGTAVLGLDEYISFMWNGNNWIEQGRNF